MFQYDKLYYFRYNPHTQPHIYDQYPQVIFLEIRGSVALGINLHWIPGALRNKFVQVIIEMRNKCINESLFHLWYRTIKYQPPLHFALSAVRKYYISNCTNIREIPQDQWDTLTLSWSLYKARYLQKSIVQPQRHIIQRGPRQYPR